MCIFRKSMIQCSSIHRLINLALASNFLCIVYQVEKLFTTVRYSEDNVTMREKEEAAFVNFLDFLAECESELCLSVYFCGLPN